MPESPDPGNPLPQEEELKTQNGSQFLNYRSGEQPEEPSSGVPSTAPGNGQYGGGLQNYTRVGKSSKIGSNISSQSSPYYKRAQPSTKILGDFHLQKLNQVFENF